ncbi:MAG TPA: aspartyl protease family protein, partial [Gemmataceae bacterium]|nr:aspartyl protease family protein [Gemmataceae bacterium]
MKRLLTVICIALVTPAFLHAQDDKKKDEPKQEPAKKFVVPFELIKTQHMVVSVKVNGKGPYRMVFDTGAPDSIVSSKVANEAEIFGKGKKKVSGGLLFGGGGQAKIKEIQ